MDRTILNFIAALRKAGIPVSPGEAIDCLNALTLVDGLGGTYKDVFKTTLIKSSEDMITFEKVFRLFFGIHKTASEMTPNKKQLHHPASLQRGSLSDGRGLIQSGAGGPAEVMSKWLLQGDMENLRFLTQQSLARLQLQSVEDLNDLNDLVRQVQISMEWFMAENMLKRLYEKNEIDPINYQQVLDRLEQLKDYVEEQLEVKVIRDFGGDGLDRLLTLRDYKHLHFNQLSEQQVIQVRHYLHKLGKKLATRKSRRYKKGKKGKLDIREIIQKARRTGGVPLKLAYESRRIDRPELVVLCDISRSVARFSYFMLQLVYIIQHCFQRVHSFVFVDDIQEITDWMKQLDFADMLDTIHYGTKVSITGYSDFGHVFFQFRKQYLHLVDEKTTLLIIADGKNNWREPNYSDFAHITELAKRTIWLNPEPIHQWNKGDSIIGRYARWCDQVFECSNLMQLESVVKQVL